LLPSLITTWALALTEKSTNATAQIIRILVGIIFTIRAEIHLWFYRKASAFIAVVLALINQIGSKYRKNQK
jgi:hypothetical protein